MQRPSIIRIGTRQSILALAQAEIVRQKLLTLLPGTPVELVPMMTSGDRNNDRSLADIGGKGLFTKELEEGLLHGSLTIAVHSLKDMETHLTKGLIIGAVLERDDPRDALVAPHGTSLLKLPHGAKVGTSSVRRQAQLKIVRPDLEIVPFRGNVTSRLAKVKSGVVDATLLAIAGLMRVGSEQEATEILDTEHFIPAAGQGTIAIECNEKDETMRHILQSINHQHTHIASITERSLLAGLDGSCRTPIGGYARIINNELVLDAMVAKTDGSMHVRLSRTGNPEDGLLMGKDVADEILARGGRECLQ